MGTTLKVPEVAFAPDHAPEAVHEVVLPDDQVNVLLPPAMMELEFADMAIVGGWVAIEEDELALLDTELETELDTELDTELLALERLELLELVALLELLELPELAATTLIEKVGIVL